MTPLRCLVLSLSAMLLATGGLRGEWRPGQGHIATRWAADVSPDNPLPEYPRPRMVRDQWVNLNGLWQYAIRPQSQTAPPTSWDGEILVPFPIESALSGVMQGVEPDQRLWYRTTFVRPAEWDRPETLLHFGAVDWAATVWVNGRHVGSHAGGYDPFHCDIRPALIGGGPQELIVSVSDPTDDSFQPRGKQLRNPHGIWYTPVTGIWQTVWIEPVSRSHIQNLRVETSLEQQTFSVIIELVEPASEHAVEVQWTSHDVSETVHHAINSEDIESGVVSLTFPIPEGEQHLWTPENPHLVDLTCVLAGDDQQILRPRDAAATTRDNVPPAPRPIDRVESYFGIREIALKKDDAGINRLFLNNKPVFQIGPLDQGWWPDGLYTAPTDEALRYDIEVTKQLGFNMCRKHVKVEPQRWYYWCDVLGLLVWQDMPSGDKYIRPTDPDPERSAESEANFRREWRAVIEANRAHPSIVAWVPFNEGWGQFKTNEILDWTKSLDPTRLVDGPSGWTDRGGGDMYDMHRYPGPAMFPVEERRASVLGEFGGLGLPVDGHTWVDKDNWGYCSFSSPGDLQRAYEQIVGQLPWLIEKGLSAAVYTQTTDVEVEVNGLMTYDRAVIKYDAGRLAALHARLADPPPSLEVVVPTSEETPQNWSYTTEKPAEGWERKDFDATSWQTGPGGFGTPETPGAHIGTVWNTPDIWLRRTFDLAAAPADQPLYLRLHHDEDAEVYLNGVLAAKFTKHVTDYIITPVDPLAAQALVAGKNTLAVHCQQTGGGQSIDVGLMRATAAATAAERRADGAGDSAVPVTRTRTIAGTGAAASSGDHGPAIEAGVHGPHGLAVGPDGGLYFGEVPGHRIRRIDPTTGAIETIAGTGESGRTGDGGPATEARIDEPYELAFDFQQNLYFVDMKQNVVRRIDALTKQISTVVGTGTAGFSGDGGPATGARLKNPHSICFDDQKRMYVCDIGNHRVRVIDLATGRIETLVGNGQKDATPDGAPLAGTPLSGPRAVCFDGKHSLYLALREGNAVYRIDLADRTLHHVAGAGQKGYAGDGGDARSAQLNGPKGIAADRDGNIYIADTENHAIRVIRADSGTIETLAGNGIAGDGPDGDPGRCRLARPHGVCTPPPPEGHAVYIGDSENNRVRVVETFFQRRDR